MLVEKSLPTSAGTLSQPRREAVVKDVAPHLHGTPDYYWPSREKESEDDEAESDHLKMARAQLEADDPNAASTFKQLEKVPDCDLPKSLIGEHSPIITASSEWSENDVANKSRMNQVGWAALDFDRHPWLEYDFTQKWSSQTGTIALSNPVFATIVKVKTLGRDWNQYVTKFLLEFSRDGYHWIEYPVEFTGSNNTNSIVENDVDPPIIASKLRIHIKDWHGAAASRVDLIGCLFTNEYVYATTTTTSTTTATTTTFGGCNPSKYNATLVERDLLGHQYKWDKIDRLESTRIFCWMLMLATGYEVQVVRRQYENKWGIFKCEDHLILSSGDEGVEIGADESSIPIGRVHSDTGDWGSWTNARVFLKAWEAIVYDCRYMGSDWVVKVDPDTVFFPHRLKTHMQWNQIPWSGDDPWWLHNWNVGYWMIGAIEVMSRAALERYSQRWKECVWIIRSKLGPCPGAEDTYIARCLNDQLQVPRRVDENCAQHYGGHNHCWDKSKVAYHPFKNVDGQERCVKEATRED
jgi:hypothetical protein